MRQSFFLFKTAVFLLVFFVAKLVAQNNDMINLFNQIKRDHHYLAQESTAEVWQEAYNSSFEQLRMQVNNERLQLGLEMIDTASFQSIAKHISMPRGPLQRVLVYVLVTDISQPLDSANQRRNNISNIDSSMSDEVTDALLSPIILEADTTENSRKMEPILMSLSLAETATEASWLLKTYYDRGDLVEYGRIKDESPIEVGKYLLIYNAKLIILALIQVQEEGLYNIKTKTYDSMDNYPECGIVWFK